MLGELKKILRQKVKKIQPRELSRQENGRFAFSQAVGSIIDDQRIEFLSQLRIENGSDFTNSAYEGTCNWIFEHKEYVSWLKEDHCPLLWLSGTAGTGKSTLVKHISQELTQMCLGSNVITASYFFCHSSDISSRSASGLFRSLLFQLLSQIPSVMSDHVPLFHQKWESYSGFGRSREQWLAKNFEDLLGRSISKISNTHELRIIIDGLDECWGEEAVRVLAFFSSIHSEALENAVRLCVSARPHASIEPFCHPKHRKIFLAKENCKDIQRFTQMKLEGQPRLSVRKPYILKSLVKRASGMFLWVSLVLDLLAHENGTGEISEKTLRAIPTSLDAIYCTILDRLTENTRDSGGLARKILTWLTFANRPLSLQELQEALQVDALLHYASSTVPKSLVINGSFSASNPDKTAVITELCWGFVETREYQRLGNTSDSMADGETSDLVLHLVHESAREYLKNRNSKETSSEVAWKDVPSESPDMYIANVCLHCLWFHAETSPPAQSVIQQRPKYLLLHYATMYWPEHAKLADQQSSSHQTLLRHLRWPSTKVISCWSRLYQKMPRHSAISPNGGWKVEHAAAAFGLYNLALAIHGAAGFSNATWDVGDATGRTPLSWAAERGHLSIVRLILQKGARMNTRDNRHGLSPLHWAASKGHRTVVEVLLEAGADVDDYMGGSTPLAIAVARGHQTVVKTLLERGADPNLIDKHYGQVPLHISAARGKAIVVSHLLAHGANPNILDCFSKRTPLYYATSRSHQEIVRLLLDYGAGTPCTELDSFDGSPTTWVDRVIYALLRAPRNLPLRCPRSSDTALGPDTSPSYKGSESASGTSKETQRTSRKRGHDGQTSSGGNENGGSGNDPNKHPALNLAPPSVGGPNLKLACPYFKYDPGRYSAQKTCRGPDGWPDVRRLKYELLPKLYGALSLI